MKKQSLQAQANKLKETARAAADLATYMKFSDHYSLNDVAAQLRLSEQAYNEWQLFVKRHKLA